jgi:hypothetical protein
LTRKLRESPNVVTSDPENPAASTEERTTSVGDLDDRAAEELDALVQRLAVMARGVDREKHEAERDERHGADGGGLPVLDEIELGVVKNAQHGMAL